MPRMYPGHPHCFDETMTVAELREKLDEFPADIPVIATWEGLLVGITNDDFSLQKSSDNRMELHIDVDQW